MAQVGPVSPLAPASFPDLPKIAGVDFATHAAAIKYKGRDDVMLARLAPGTSVAGVFTKSSTRSAAVLDCQAKVGRKSDSGAAILVNAGNANAFTGQKGQTTVEEVTRALASAIAVPKERVFTASTGVIGEPLPPEQITNAIDTLISNLSPDGLGDAARAIMTTDTFPKAASRTLETSGGRVTIAGIAKGSGMIAPDMATMLSYVFTDASIAPEDLQALLTHATEHTFNAITVDSDTSTSDTLMVAATGASGVDVTDDEGFKDALTEVLKDLAHQVVRDGEGATKFVEITVTGARSQGDARTHAMAIANSPLVKTAIAGEDPNWGRVVMAIGKSDAEADRDKISIRFGDVLVAENGWISPDYDESLAAEHMKQAEVRITVDLGLGISAQTVWTCDLTHRYIEINADYRS